MILSDNVISTRSKSYFKTLHAKFIGIHGYKYDYSKVVYVGAKAKIDIICEEHGVFSQSVLSHLNGQGCPACSGKKKITTDDFVSMATRVHGDKYDYSRSIAKGQLKKIDIICPKHGVFSQEQKRHLSGSGCPKCGVDHVSRVRIERSRNNFAQRAKKIHRDKYCYDDVVYTGSTNKIKIFCNKHNGFFYQSPADHLQGHGCNRCRDINWIKSNTRKSLHNDFIVYYARVDTNNETFFKVGITSNLKKRFNFKYPYVTILSVSKKMNVSDAFIIESLILDDHSDLLRCRKNCSDIPILPNAGGDNELFISDINSNVGGTMFSKDIESVKYAEE